MRYKLFLSDFDGTLVREDGTVSPRNIRAIAEYRARGGVFAVVTGRMLRSILPRLKELGLEDGIAVAYQGGMIADIRTGELFKNDGFPPEEAIKAIAMLEEEGQHIQIYANDRMYCNRRDELLESYERKCRVKGVIPEEKLSELVAREKMTVTKVLVMLPPEEKLPLVSRMRERLGSGFTVTTSNEWLVEAVPAGVSKARAVDFLAERYRIPREEVAAIGDQLNDLPMIERAGGKFAVANAQEPLKQIATVVASCEEDGVAEALEYAMGD